MKNNKELTPIMELIQHVSIKGFKNYPLDTLELIKELLQKEKQVIEDALDFGVEFSNDMNKISDYYNTKFNNQIK